MKYSPSIASQNAAIEHVRDVIQDAAEGARIELLEELMDLGEDIVSSTTAVPMEVIEKLWKEARNK
jgi:hypothetical protein